MLILFQAYDGGAFGLSNRYASGFLWLNKLGLAAEYNYKVNYFNFIVLFQTLGQAIRIESCAALVDL